MYIFMHCLWLMSSFLCWSKAENTIPYLTALQKLVLLCSFLFYDLGIMLEFISLCVQVMHLDAEKEMMSQCVALLGKFIAVREPNIRYLGLVSH